MADINKLTITLQQRIREQTVPFTLQAAALPNQGHDSFGNTVAFLITTWIDKIALVAPDGVTETAAPDVPLEIFLYQKLNNILPADGTPVREQILGSSFLRCLEPSDIDPNNPTLFGAKESLKWLKDPWTYTGTNQLMPTTDAAGGALILASAEDAYSPLNTKNTSGYYVSRVHQMRTLDPSQAREAMEQMKVACRAFAAKYNSQMQVLFEEQQGGAWINNGYGL